MSNDMKEKKEYTASKILRSKEELAKDIVSLQEIVKFQENNFFDLSKEKTDLQTRLHFLEKKEQNRKEDDFQLQNYFQEIVSKISKYEEELFTSKIVKEQLEDNRKKLAEAEKIIFSQKLKVSELEHDLNQKEISISEFRDEIQSRKSTLKTEKELGRRERFISVQEEKSNHTELDMDVFLKKLAEKDVIISNKTREILELKKKYSEPNSKVASPQNKEDENETPRLQKKIEKLKLKLASERLKATVPHQSLSASDRSSAIIKKYNEKVKELETSLEEINLLNDNLKQEKQTILYEKQIAEQKLLKINSKLNEKENELKIASEIFSQKLNEKEEELYKEKKNLISAHSNIKSLQKENAYLVSHNDEIKALLFESKKAKISADDELKSVSSRSNKNILATIEKNVQKITSVIMNIQKKNISVSEEISEIFPNKPQKQNLRGSFSREIIDSTKDTKPGNHWFDSGIINLLNELQDNVSLAQSEFTEEDESVTHHNKSTDIIEKVNLDDRSVIIGNLQREVEQMEQMLSILSSEKMSLESIINVKNEVIMGLEQERSQMQSGSTQNLIRANKRIEELELNLKELKSQNDTLNSEKVFFSKDLYAADLEISELKSKLKGCTESLTKYLKDFSVLGLDYKTLLSGLNLLIDQNRKLKNDFLVLTSESNYKYLSKLSEEIEFSKVYLEKIDEKMIKIETKEKNLRNIEYDFDQFRRGFYESFGAFTKVNETNSLQFFIKENESLRESYSDVKERLRMKGIESNEVSHRLVLKGIELDDVKLKLQRLELENVRLNERVRELEKGGGWDSRKSRIIDLNLQNSIPQNPHSGQEHFQENKLFKQPPVFAPYPYEQIPNNKGQSASLFNSNPHSMNLKAQNPMSNASFDNMAPLNTEKNISPRKTSEHIEKSNRMSLNFHSNDGIGFSFKPPVITQNISSAGNMGRLAGFNMNNRYGLK